jgi:thioredoxin-like negative regulator of GroEL
MKNILAALLVAVVLGATAVYLTGRRPPDRARDASSGVVNPPDPPPVDAAAYRAAFPLEPPERQLLIGVTDSAGTAMSDAMRAFRAGRYQDAASQFEQVWTDHPDRSEAALYLGIARLFMDEIPAGIEVLRHAQASPEPGVAAAAQWYALVGIARLREPASGMAEAREVCEKPGPVQARTCAALEALPGPR